MPRQNLADGQVSLTSTALLSNTTLQYPAINIHLRNTSGSLTETVQLTIQRQGGTARNLPRVVLAPNESALFTNIPFDAGDTLNGSTSDASTVDYLISDLSWGYGGPMAFQTFDASGIAKTTQSSGISATLSGTLSVAGNTTLSSYVLFSHASAITAGTTRTQGGATVLASEVNRVDTSTAPSSGTVLGDGVLLPASSAGLDILIWNNTSNPIQVYPSGTDTINGGSASAAVVMPPNSVDMYVCPAAGAWVVEGGIGFAGSLETVLACTSISATGTTQGTAAQLVAALNKVTTATGGSAVGVKLPASQPGLDCIVENHSGVALQVYGAGTDTIDDVATATGVQQMDSSVVIYTCYEAGKWYSNGLATGYAKNPQAGVVLETVQFADSISAAGTTQGTATQLTAAISNVTTVASGTGVNLPASSAGLSVVVQNNGANPLIVYPAQGASDTVNGQAATTGVVLLVGAVGVFNCTTAGAWTVQTGSTKMAAYATNTAVASATLGAANVTGGIGEVDLNMTGTLTVGSTATLPTVAAVLAALHTPTVGSSYRLRVINSSSGNFAWTVGTNTGWTLNGTMTVNQNTWRDFVVTITAVGGSPAATLQSVGTGTYS